MYKCKEYSKLWFISLLLAVFMSGCGGGGGGTENWDPAAAAAAAAAAAGDTTPPTVLVSPIQGAIDVCPNTPITATFNEAMDETTIIAANFTLALNIAPFTSLGGAVTYDSITKVATFTPAPPLVSGVYIATLKGGASGVKDSAGNPLAGNALGGGVDYAWTFTVITGGICTAPLDLRSAGSFVLLSETLTNANATVLTGNVGRAGVTTPPTVIGTTYIGAAAERTQAKADYALAVTEAQARTCDYSYAAATDISTIVPLFPGVHCITGAMSFGSSRTITTPGVYIFNSTGAFTSAPTIAVSFAGTANASNTQIFFVPREATSLGANNTFLGSILQSDASAITVGDTTTISSGRVFSDVTVTLDNDTITIP